MTVKKNSMINNLTVIFYATAILILDCRAIKAPINFQLGNQYVFKPESIFNNGIEILDKMLQNCHFFAKSMNTIIVQ